MGAVCIVETQNAAVVCAKEMRQQERQIVTNNLTSLIHPNLFSQNADPASTAEARLVIVFLDQALASTHGSA